MNSKPQVLSKYLALSLLSWCVRLFPKIKSVALKAIYRVQFLHEIIHAKTRTKKIFVTGSFSFKYRLLPTAVPITARGYGDW